MAVKGIDLEGIDGGLVKAINRALEAAEHLMESDRGAVSLALKFANAIEEALNSSDPAERDKVLFGAVPSLNKQLTELGLTPQGRHNLDLNKEEEEDDDDF